MLPVVNKMLEHAADVLGMEIVFMIDKTEQFCASLQMYSLPEVLKKKRHSTVANEQLPAMLLPKNADMYVVYTDSNSCLFVRSPAYSGCFFLQERWEQLAPVLQQDSVCRAIVYRDKSQKLIMGVYDVLQLQGVAQTHLSVLQRHTVLHSLFANHILSDSSCSVCAHWLGEEGCLLQHMKKKQFCDSLPFDLEHMLRIEECAGTETYTLVLKPLQLP